MTTVKTYDASPAFDCGWLAANQGADWRDNPFSCRSLQWHAWSAGWNVRIAEIKMAQAGRGKR